MILSEITNGLGNQMFQYAAARRLAHRHHATLKLDLNAYHAANFRSFRLDHFNVQAQIAGWSDMLRFCPEEALRRASYGWLHPGVARRLTRAVNQFHLTPYHNRIEPPFRLKPRAPLMLGRVVSERYYHFDPEVLECPDNVALTGYWQTEKYFQDIAEIIREEFTIKTPMGENIQKLAGEITGCESVFLHIRRGDKVNDPYPCITDLDHCRRALDFFRARLREPRFFVFSDDWTWVEANFPSAPDVVHMRHKVEDYEDLHLMSLCRHSIVAPSTFSWWAAWLNRFPGKIVVRPHEFTRIPNFDSKDVFPSDWISLS